MPYPVAACRGRWNVGGAVTRVYDTFTDTNGVDLDAHTPDTDVAGGGWNKLLPAAGNVIEIQSNKAFFDGNAPSNNGAVCTIETNRSDVVVTANVLHEDDSDSASGIIVRSLDIDNFWHMTMYQGTLYLVEIDATASTTRDTDNSLVDGTYYDMTLTANGQSLSGSAGGAAVSYSSALHQSETKCGVRLYTQDISPNLDLDEFKVEVA